MVNVGKSDQMIEISEKSESTNIENGFNDISFFIDKKDLFQ